MQPFLVLIQQAGNLEPIQKTNPFLPTTTEQTNLIKKYKDFSNNLLTNVFNQVPHLRERKWTVENDDYSFNLSFNDLEPEIQNGFYNRVKSTIVLNPSDLVNDLVNYIQDEGLRYIDQIASNHLLQLLLSKQMDRQLANGTEMAYTFSTSAEKGTNSGTTHTNINRSNEKHKRDKFKKRNIYR